MQQPDYTSAPYYAYPPNPNPNPTPPPPSSSTYASAPPYNHPYPPQFPQIPDPIPPNQNPNSNFPQFTPTPPQTPLSLSSFDHHAAYPPPPPQPNSYYPQSDPHHSAHNYPQLGPYEGNHPKFDQFESSRVDYGLTQFGSGSAHGGVEFDYRGSKTNYPQLGPYEGSNEKFDQFGSSRVDPGSTRFDSGSGQGGYGEGVYAYQGSKTEPYGARGTGSRSWGVDSGSTRFDTGSVFDDFGRPIGKGSTGPTAKVVRAVPKAESQEDVKSGVQKFRVKLLAESGGQTTMDVLCQIGLDGIRMLDPTTSRTLRIYPLETVTRYEILDSSIFAFWAKSSVDIEPRRIRLKSNSYTSSTILDIVTAAAIQFKEIGGRSRPSDSFKPVEQPPEKKKGLGDWMNLMKPGNEEKDHWVPDEAVSKCTSCATDFSAFVRRHHCRNCGDIFCDKCTHGRIALTAEENAQPVRVCDRCLAEVTHRLNIAKETTNRSTAGLQSHEDLAKKLQEEMEKNRRASSGSRSDGSGRRMKEVACPTCTVHLQVQVPSSGSETIECGVCQHPFLVSAR